MSFWGGGGGGGGGALKLYTQWRMSNMLSVLTRERSLRSRNMALRGSICHTFHARVVFYTVNDCLWPTVLLSINVVAFGKPG